MLLAHARPLAVRSHSAGRKSLIPAEWTDFNNTTGCH
jgi:hypothetical protein